MYRLFVLLSVLICLPLPTAAAQSAIEQRLILDNLRFRLLDTWQELHILDQALAADQDSGQLRHHLQSTHQAVNVVRREVGQELTGMPVDQNRMTPEDAALLRLNVRHIRGLDGHLGRYMAHQAAYLRAHAANDAEARQAAILALTAARIEMLRDTGEFMLRAFVGNDSFSSHSNAIDAAFTAADIAMIEQSRSGVPWDATHGLAFRGALQEARLALYRAEAARADIDPVVPREAPDLHMDLLAKRRALLEFQAARLSIYGGYGLHFWDSDGRAWPADAIDWAAVAELDRRGARLWQNAGPVFRDVHNVEMKIYQISVQD